MLTLAIGKLQFPNNADAPNPIVVDLFIKGYYQPDSAYMLIEANVNVGVDGTVEVSPLPAVSIDPSQRYVLKAVNDLCGFVYTQPVILYPYCPPGYTLSSDDSSCFYILETPATPPTNSQNAELIVGPNNYYYGIFGTLIFNPGYAMDGTGSFTQIPYSNTFWVNGPGYPSYPSTSQVLGPLNRCGVWSPTVLAPQTIGFSVCIEAPVDGTYYVGMGCDDYGQINVDGVTVVAQVKADLLAYFAANGYPTPIGLDPNQICFNFWYVYPVALTAGSHVIEIIGNNTSGTVYGAATVGCEVYNLTPAEITAATSYAAMGAGLIFSSKDYAGMPIQVGSAGIGFSCPSGYSLKFCDSPPSCVQIVTTPVLY
jgi:hypothetical protein